MRPLYTTASLLSARELSEGQADLLNRLRRHDRFAHGFGVVCGLKVCAAPTRRQPWTVGVCPGYAVDPCGDEIEVPSRVTVDVREFFWSRPYLNAVALRFAIVGLRFAGQTCGAAQAPSGCDCGCGRASGASGGRIGDGYAVDILWSLERTPAPAVDLCGSEPVPCPAIPTGKHILLAVLRLPASEATPLTGADIIQL